MKRIGRVVKELNEGWIFFDYDVGDVSSLDTARDGRRVVLPHMVKTFPLSNFDDKDYQKITWYRKEVSLPSSYAGKRIFLEFDGVMLVATVYVNGKKVGEHKGGFTPFRFDITDKVGFGQRNTIAVKVDSRERPDVPPFGGTVDYLTFGGIYREVRLIITDTLYIEDIFPFCVDVLSPHRRLVCNYVIRNEMGKSRSFNIRFSLKDWEGLSLAEVMTDKIALEGNATLHSSIELTDLASVRLWDIEEPWLYKVELSIFENERCIDSVEKSFGFREARFAEDGGFYLNGRRIKLIGLNRHQNYPYIGPAAPRRLQYRDADILKYELGLNIVRCSHYPQSPHFLDRCDQIGLLVFEELPGWQYIGDEEWKRTSLNELREMIIRDRHHPSIILWGVRINESRDDDEFYRKTNALAHELDPTRQTGGVRNFRESHFLEDVFTYNDFSGKIQPPNHIPYMVTEFGGHTFPTKSFDLSQRQVEHALLHTRIQDEQLGRSDIAGAIGWCSFDYNTHVDFGSGDRICYHGVCDIFRMPKFAAMFYKSQIPVEKRVVLELADLWAFGDWNHGIEQLVIFSNCDYIDVIIGGRELKGLKARSDLFRNLRYPPFIVEMHQFWGGKWKDLTVVGYVNGKEVKRLYYPMDRRPVRLCAWCDDEQILADNRDMTWLRFAMVDSAGNIAAYARDIVWIEPKNKLVEIIGENPFALIASRGAVFLRAKKKKGTEDIELRTNRGHKASVSIKLI